ncbi:UDP-Glc/Gal endoplasmic reticulum nucleotide sugar transporter [Apiospora rasikravindrae]|uniref:UDP-galactose transporter homolog 1 n=1 Tax=Apiospora rasikravindrae TaxID=990691 RepID=A0ABR1UBM8_9PEZI
MARTKQAKPIERQSSSEYIDGQNSTSSKRNIDPIMAHSDKSNGALSPSTKASVAPVEKADAGVLQLLDMGIPAGEAHDDTPRPPGATEVFKYPVFLNTIQSLFAATTGAHPRGAPLPAIFPSQRIVAPLLLVALTSSLASPFGYASLAHIDYITFLLAKSCKLLPVMFLHITVFRKRYPLYKYLVVAAVTAGVAVFTLHSGKKGGSKKHTSSEERNMPWGLLLLSINLLFDGLTNSTQDYIFQTFQPYTGPQMMCANNLMSTAVTASYLLLSPWLVQTGIGEWLGMDVAGSAGELGEALQFMARNPSVWADVLGFAACGAVGQVFIFYTLSTFSSVLLVTVTVTRKMFTMILSVVAFGHRLTQMQVLGVGLVFGGIGVEAAIARQEKMAKEEAKRKAKAGKAQ